MSVLEKLPFIKCHGCSQWLFKSLSSFSYTIQTQTHVNSHKHPIIKLFFKFKVCIFRADIVRATIRRFTLEKHRGVWCVCYIQACFFFFPLYSRFSMKKKFSYGKSFRFFFVCCETSFFLHIVCCIGVFPVFVDYSFSFFSLDMKIHLWGKGLFAFVVNFLGIFQNFPQNTHAKSKGDEKEEEWHIV